MILGIDPGSEQSGWVLYDGEIVSACGVYPNAEVLNRLGGLWSDPGVSLVIEMMRARGMPVSNDEMRTLVWIGRFQQAWLDPEAVRLVYRQDVKLHVCGTSRAKDSNVRQALIDKLGPPGTKKNPGPTYGVTSHAWQALAVAVTAAETA